MKVELFKHSVRAVGAPFSSGLGRTHLVRTCVDM